MKVGQFHRQGDVLIERINEIPKNKAETLKEVKGRVILALGEATGHHHSVAVESALFAEDEQGVMFLKLMKDSVVEHQEHAPINLDGGNYKITIQKELNGQMVRRVAD